MGIHKATAAGSHRRGRWRKGGKKGVAAPLGVVVVVVVREFRMPVLP